MSWQWISVISDAGGIGERNWCCDWNIECTRRATPNTDLLPRVSTGRMILIDCWATWTRPVCQGPRNGLLRRRPDARKKGDTKSTSWPNVSRRGWPRSTRTPSSSVPIAVVPRNACRRVTGCHLLRSGRESSTSSLDCVERNRTDDEDKAMFQKLANINEVEDTWF